MARILAIDDDLGVLFFLKAGLATGGHEVAVAETPRAGFREACWRGADAILLDINMPGTNGLDLLKKFKGDERTSHIPIVMYTGQDVEEFKEKAYLNYAEAFVLKSATLEEILTRLEGAIATAPSAPPKRFSPFMQVIANVCCS